MEGFNKQENSNEKQSVSINLDNNKLSGSFVGQDINIGFRDLVKTYAIISQISSKGIKTEPQLKEVAEDLFNELEFETLEYEDIFTKKVRNQIFNSNGVVDSINFEMNYLPLTVRSGTTAEDLRKEYKERTTEDPVKKAEREQREKIEDERKAKEHAEKLAILLEELQSLDFANTVGVLDWLRKYNDVISFVGVTKEHNEEVIKFFESKGYSTEKNDNMEYMIADGLKDKKRYSEVTIGFILANLGWIREGHMNSLIDEWKNFE